VDSGKDRKDTKKLILINPFLFIYMRMLKVLIGFLLIVLSRGDKGFFEIDSEMKKESIKDTQGSVDKLLGSNL
jgi:hypothetical protein